MMMSAKTFLIVADREWQSSSQFYPDFLFCFSESKPSDSPKCRSGQTENQDLICSICKKKFSAKKNRNRHMKECHSNHELQSCPKCSKTFIRKEKLNEHLSIVHEGMGKCNICDIQFTSFRSMERHLRDVHQDLKYFQCPECNEKFSRSSQLKRHLDAGRHSFTIDCEYCKQTLTFKSNSAMKKHFIMIPPTKSGRKTCINAQEKNEQPSSSSSMNSSDTESQPSDTRSRSPLSSADSIYVDKCEEDEEAKMLKMWKYTCSFCNSHFSSRFNRNRHEEEKHKGTKFSCEKCSLIFTRHENLRRHENIHLPQPCMFKCSICEKDFTRQDNLEYHKQQIHGEAKFFCLDKECPKTFTRYSKFIKHMERGNHYFEYDCEYCCESFFLKEPQTSTTNRHFIKHPRLPFLSTCRNMKYGLTEKPSEEKRKKFEKRVWDKRVREEAEIEAYKYYHSSDDEFEPYVESLVQKRHQRHEEFLERQRQEKLRIEKVKKIWDAYDWDITMIDPTSLMPLSDPLRNKKCGHVYERMHIQKLIEENQSDGKETWCTYTVVYVDEDGEDVEWKGCTKDSISLSDLESDTELKAEIDKKKEARRKLIEKYPSWTGEKTPGGFNKTRGSYLAAKREGLLQHSTVGIATLHLENEDPSQRNEGYGKHIVRNEGYVREGSKEWFKLMDELNSVDANPFDYEEEPEEPEEPEAM